MEGNKETFRAALLAVQSELKVGKERHNNFGGFSYRSCSDILEAVKPLLKKQGLVLTLTDSILQLGERFYVEASASIRSCGTDTDCETSTGYAREELTKKGMDSAQVTGSASSYARKYALNGLFLIDDSRDADDPGMMAKEWNKALREIDAATTREQLDNIYNSYIQFRQNQIFLDKLNEKSKTVTK